MASVHTRSAATNRAIGYTKQKNDDDFYDDPFSIYVEGEEVWDDCTSGNSPEDCIWRRKIGPIAHQFSKRHFRIAGLVMMEQTVLKKSGVWDIMKRISYYEISQNIREIVESAEKFCYYAVYTRLCMTSGYPVLMLLDKVLRSSEVYCPSYEKLKSELGERKKRTKKIEVVPFSRLFERLAVLPEEGSAWWSHALRDEEEFHRAMTDKKDGDHVQVSVDVGGWIVVDHPEDDHYMD